QYSSTLFPPAPVLELRLSAPRETAYEVVLSALIDTGADFTLVPLDWLLRINAPESRSANVRGLWSEQRQVTTYLVDLHLEIGVLPGIEVVGVDHEEGEDLEIVIGRNVLNQLILLLDGPHQQIDLLNRRPLKL
ncbi:MAG TPA: hypothetical protein VFF59_06105, partial [Anaerolineae bacterium]|nr:hypothetical protein [Anaerolineae bacterium]